MALLASLPLRLLLLVVLAAVLGRPALFAQPAPAPFEASVKAVFLFNFSKYVTWPAQAIGERSPAEIRVCVTANDAFFNLLRTAVQGEQVDERPLIPVALDGLDEARTCQILYVGDAQSLDGRAWLNAVRGRQVLTVGDGTLNDETVISFVRDGNRIRFDINRAAAARRGLNVSSKLLRLARQVRDR
ncbi:MAG TPA: YfiR family protein [Vicinamibacterales bacterium]|nr:YfiR family protein [Vicinamibacterales bacterium]